jgi:uncharacterized protein YjiS (DUF1127 family)
MVQCTIALLPCNNIDLNTNGALLSQWRTEKRNDPKERRNEYIMNLIRNYRNWRRYRDTVSELNRLSNRELNDLGISRGDIPFVARKSI